MKTKYALKALSQLAAAPPGEPMLIADIADREGIPRKFLEAILAELKQHPEIDLVLMDLMMPEMDGYEAMRALREMPQFKSLPIIALTAKAMKGDREESIAAGASDYITKPVDIEQLLSLMQVWLYQ